MKGARALQWLRLWRVLAWLQVLAVVVLCLLPEPPDPVAVPQSDKLYHLLGYAALAAWWVQLYTREAVLPRLVGLVLLGVGLEGVQALLPWRSAELADALANAAGVVLGGALAWTPAGVVLQRCERMLRRSPD